MSAPQQSLVQPGAQEQIAVAGGRARALLETAEALTIDGPEKREFAANFRSQVKALQKSLEENRIALVNPLNDHVKRINDAFHEVGAPLDRALTIIDDKVKADRREQERIAQEAARKAEEVKQRLEHDAVMKAAQEAKAAGNFTPKEIVAYAESARAEVQVPAPALASPPKTIRAESGATLSVKKVWTFAIEDLGKVPVEYLALDTAKVRCAIRDGVREIPGLRIYQDDQVAGR